MMLLSLTAFFVFLFQSVSAVTLPCTNHYMIYEQWPDNSSPGGDWGYIYRIEGRYTATALCTVDFPSSAAGHQCRLHFTPDYVDTSPGFSRRAQVFTLGSPAISTATWNNRGTAYRNQQVGTAVNLTPGNEAGWEGSNVFPCPSTLTGFEVAPTGDNMYASWTTPHGLSVEIL